jgi:hypothetical protein
MNKAKYQPHTFIITISKLPYDVKLNIHTGLIIMARSSRCPTLLRGGDAAHTVNVTVGVFYFLK